MGKKVLAVLAFIAFCWFMLRGKIQWDNYPNYGSAAYHKWPDSWFDGISIYDNSFYWFFGVVILLTAIVSILAYKKYVSWKASQES
jgi:hypothetical protein